MNSRDGLRHTIAILLENEAGALCRVAGLFSARGYNIESLTVATTEDPTVSRMTLVTRGSPEIIEQITKQLNKLIDVIRLVDLSESDARQSIESEMMLIKLHADAARRPELQRLIEQYQGRVMDESDRFCIVQLTGDGGTLDAFLGSVEASLITEVVRSGTLGILRGERTLHA